MISDASTILTNTAPGISPFMHAIQKQLGQAMASSYLKTIAKSIQLDLGPFSKWVLMMAAERTYYGLPSEMKRLQTFIEMYVEAISSGRDKDHFYKLI